MKFTIQRHVVQMPNSDDLWMVQTQYNDEGPIFTDDNKGNGYTFEQATEKRDEFKTG